MKERKRMRNNEQNKKFLFNIKQFIKHVTFIYNNQKKAITVRYLLHYVARKSLNSCQRNTIKIPKRNEKFCL